MIVSRRRTSLYKYLKNFKISLWLQDGVRVLKSKYYPITGDRYERSVAQGRAIHQTVRLIDLYNISRDGLLKPFPLAARAPRSLKKKKKKKNRVTPPRVRLGEIHDILRDGTQTTDGVRLRALGRVRERTKRFRATGPASSDSARKNEGG